MEYLLGIDLGTSGTKTVLFDVNGSAVASATVEYPLHQPQNGWAEQDPLDWWEAAKTTIRQVLQKSRANPEDIMGLGISGQMHGLVLLDENGDVLRPAIIWNDGRTSLECAEITQIIGYERLIAITANPALTGFTAGKILWVRKNEPDIYKRAKHILLPKDYVRYKLTGEYFSEMSDASGTNLLDVPKRCWSDEILTLLRIDKNLLPPLIESSDRAGTVTPRAAKDTGLNAGTIVAAGAGDNAAAAVGTGVVKQGKAFITIGTSGVIFAHSDTVQIDPAGRVHTFCAAVPGAYTVMSCSLAAGLSLKWFRDTFCLAECETAGQMGVDPYQLMDEEAKKVQIGANRLLFLPYLMGERSPLLDSNARGAFIGLSAIHTRRDLLRAVMEGVMYSQKQNLDILSGMRVLPDAMLATGGGAKSTLWREMIADVLQMPVKTVANTEGPALGAAILAGVAAGVYEDIPGACEKIIRENEPLTPDKKKGEAYHRVYEIYQSLYPALKDTYRKLIAVT
ncbi:MAG: xylulokinase [Eubacteriales bacterium]|jgi:xylulokinase|nr:xylulokinase [Eubacteriales bacterium]